VTDQDQHDQPQGPEDPHGDGGIDAPAPPGGPQRTDAPATGHTPGDPAPDDGSPRVTRDEGPEPPPPVDDPDASQGDASRREQAENAEASLDQPSG
jgi:hypothetical protein